MGSTRIEVFIHFSWQTLDRSRILRGDLEYFLHNQIRSTCDELDLHPLAVNSAWDHVHTLVGWNAEMSFQDAVQKFKGRTSYRWNNHERDPAEAPKLEWQEGYGAFSIRKDEIGDVRRYIDLQKEHHQERELWWRFERHLWRKGEK